MNLEQISDSDLNELEKTRLFSEHIDKFRSEQYPMLDYEITVKLKCSFKGRPPLDSKEDEKKILLWFASDLIGEVMNCYAVKWQFKELEVVLLEEQKKKEKEKSLFREG